MSRHIRTKSPDLSPRTPARDPLRLCIFTTIGLLAWLLTPPLVVTFFAGMGIWAYTKAYRGGLKTSKCILKDTRLVLAYLGAAFVAGAFFTVKNVMDIIG
ncbi:MAG TPA: hypothetical protein VFV09_12610 [Actinomycetota bacterium]|nr:hypothetical protein [Actinomycetota bacterium]